jgi:hypothetical protein
VGGPQVADRVIDLSLGAVRLAPPVVGDHRGWPQGEGAAERLEGGIGLAGPQGPLSLDEQLPILPVLVHTLHHRHRRRGQPDEAHEKEGALHRRILRLDPRGAPDFLFLGRRPLEH